MENNNFNVEKKLEELKSKIASLEKEKAVLEAEKKRLFSLLEKEGINIESGEDLKVYVDKLSRDIEEFESKYSDILKKFDGYED